MKKAVTLVMLPTEDKTNIFQCKNGQILYTENTGTNTSFATYIHLYATVSKDVEPIKEGDCSYDETSHSIYKVGKFISKAAHESHSIIPLKSDVKKGETYTYVGIRYSQYARKIVATTDLLLGKCFAQGVGSSGYERVGEMSQSFLEKFASNPNDEYRIEYELICSDSDDGIADAIFYKNYIVKLNSDNIVNMIEPCEHPYKRLHWVNNIVYCNKCDATLEKKI
jgi:hypothetical protein